MSKIHYFQRYSSVENTVTNNTLQLIARIYDHSTAAASQLLSNLTGEAIEIGVEIRQQNRMGNAVPDGSIIQRSFKILIEAKVDSGVDVAQLVRHAGTFGHESQKLLLLLTKQTIGPLEEEIRRTIQAKYPDVLFVAITYEAICEAIKGLFKSHESSMAALVEDYIEYCNDANLFHQAQNLMKIVPCGKSAGLNRKYGIYFHPSDRGYTEHAFIGVYANKAVTSIIEIESVFDIELVDGVLNKTLEQGADTTAFDEPIRRMIDEALEVCGYDVTKGTRFFCGRVVDTDYRKASPNGIQGARFVNLKDLLGERGSLDEIAQKLRNLEWT